jgi:hypothetical protein
MRAGHDYIARVRAMRGGRMRTMHATQRQPGGGPATTTVRACLAVWRSSQCSACGAPVLVFHGDDGVPFAMQPPLKAWPSTDPKTRLVEGVPHWQLCTGVRR